jgi:hypothetical protein
MEKATLEVLEPGPTNWHPSTPAPAKFPAEKLKVTAVAFEAVKFNVVAPEGGQTSRAGFPLVVMRIPVVEDEV